MANQNQVHYFGVRHHGPGCARSLLSAIEKLKPDCLLVEGPEEGEVLLPMLSDPALKPPVAMLAYAQDNPEQAAFFPFAIFSPEWQALKWAQSNGVITRFIDLPQKFQMGLTSQAQELLAQKLEAQEGCTPALYSDHMGLQSSLDMGEEPAEADLSEAAQGDIFDTRDPLDLLASAAGYADGESWWNRLVEERSEDVGIFEAINEAMKAIREHMPQDFRGADYATREERREAWMRQCIRAAKKEGFERIAVVCGAWHIPALMDLSGMKKDAITLKGLPKLKVTATWAPWTYSNLCSASGYGAGVDAPGWYEHLWNTSDQYAGLSNSEVSTRRTAGWMARISQVFRKNGLDCSSAHMIEATRLSETLASFRGKSTPGLEEFDEAIKTVLCMGEDTQLRLIHRELTVGSVIGSVPEGVPQVPLHRDIEQEMKRLRLKAEEAVKTVALDLRNENDLAKSHLFHRMKMLGIRWALPARNEAKNKGTFRESWQLKWEPQVIVSIIEASRYGGTLHQACASYLLHKLLDVDSLALVAEGINDAILADLPELVDKLVAVLSQKAALTGDVSDMLKALPALANVYRYGNVRKTDSEILSGLIDTLIVRASIGLPVACMSMDPEAATSMRMDILSGNEAVRLREDETSTKCWLDAMKSMANGEAAAPLIRGMASRFLLDAKIFDGEEISLLFSKSVSAIEPAESAYWLDGFLNDQALVLIHDDAIWGAVDQWMTSLTPPQFIQVLPMIRRSFSNFSNQDRHSLGEKAARADAGHLPQGNGSEDCFYWDEGRAAQAAKKVCAFLGLSVEV